MAIPEHLKTLRKGVKAWHKSRKEYSKVFPDLSGADLVGADL